MNNSQYHAQADLMIKVLPIVAAHKEFALKGGTALNFFILDMPRLSVDIDLAFLKISERDDALSEIDNLLVQIADKISNTYGYHVHRSKLKGTNYLIKLVVRNANTQVKIEPSPSIRGAVYPTELRSLSQKVKDTFYQDTEITVLSESDLYGGKICAALDRQHPRDLFDIYLMFQNGGITDQIRKAFLVYLISHKRPMSELLNPNFKDIEADYINSFEGMAIEEFALDKLMKIRSTLVKEINKGLTEKDKDFLLSVASGKASFDLFDLQHISKYPAIMWKISNIEKMDSRKKDAEIKKLKEIISK